MIITIIIHIVVSLLLATINYYLFNYTLATISYY